MSAVVSELARSASHLISEFGTAMVLHHVSAETYDVASGTTTQTKAEYDITAVAVKYKIDDIDGQSVLRDDRKVYVKAEDGKTPAVGDAISGLGADVKIVSVHDLVKPVGGFAVHICQVRG